MASATGWCTLSTSEYIISDSGKEGSGQEKDVVLMVKQSIHIVTKTPGRCSVEIEGWPGGGNGVTCFCLEIASGIRGDLNCRLCSRMLGCQSSHFS